MTQIFLDDNLIADKNKAKAKLSLKYPTAYISLWLFNYIIAVSLYF